MDRNVKIRGTPSHIAEKYVQLARDSQSSGDPVSAENYYQHAEHYFRLIAAAQEQFRQNNPQFYRPENDARNDARDETFDDDDSDDAGQPMIGNASQPMIGNAGQPPMMGSGEMPFGTREPQPFLPREAQPFPPREQPNHVAPPVSQVSQQPAAHDGDVDRLPSFITGGQPNQAPRPQPNPQNFQGGQNYGNNGHDNQGDRFPLHRRRRRHRSGPRQDFHGGPQSGGTDNSTPRE